ncbi:MAG: substrate-binding domain-containing protein, partial [Chloroflexota bacterium]
NAAEALSAIGEQEIPLVSRGDDSGTNIKELSIWADTPFDPNDSKPGWYVESGQGMGATLLIASERFGYTLTDRATYLANRQNLNLDILVEGDDGLLNIYHAITVNPDMWPDSNYDGAIAFANFLTAAETQEAIGQFGVEAYGQPLFFANAN